MMSRLEQLTEELAAVIETRIKPKFKTGCHVTVMVRFPDDTEGRCDVLVSDDTDEGIRALIGRRLEPATKDQAP